MELAVFQPHTVVWRCLEGCSSDWFYAASLDNRSTVTHMGPRCPSLGETCALFNLRWGETWHRWDVNPHVSLHIWPWPVRSAAPPAALLTNDGLPFPIGLRNLIGAAHLAEGHAADDEDYDTRPGAILSRRLILVPVAVPSTVRAERNKGHVVIALHIVPVSSLHSFYFQPFWFIHSTMWIMLYGQKHHNNFFNWHKKNWV